ncbi:uncharacterized protein lcorl isoform X1 [Genypterus blacodes]|uniref:uncharacterized protein lcorl isoform X1 n=1 Tax=Genypterus blacodes TaxID=154954 RepID=UPI003F75E914
MAAVQCRSSKCTAERKGFRRELDSWRHKLIHCVGFESILEGIYGPLLLRDLNLFEDCEPEEVNDWSPEVSCSNCSFCNLPLDKLSDHVPAATSPVSSPSDYSPTQAPTVSECSQLAHRFLQAVFHRKDVSIGSDSNIPLVAQELMKKMIHQFALEYASKSLLHKSQHGTNGTTTRASSPLSDMSDTPLDLTLTRSQEKESEPLPDGVLDLSKRNSACPAASTSASSPNHKASGFLLTSLKEECGDVGQREIPELDPNSGLNAVLSSLCPAHRSLLYQILKLAHQEQLLLFLHCRPVDQKDSQHCHCSMTTQDNGPARPFPFGECKAPSSSPHCPFIDCHHQGHGNTVFHHGDSESSCSNCHCPFNCKSKADGGCCCVQSCRVPACPVLCLKGLHCVSCQSLAVGHIDNMVCSLASSPSLSESPSLSASHLCPAPSICCHQHNPHSCPCYSNHVCLTQVRNSVKREQSPSPPPLSPIPSDISSKTEEKPPSLLHHIQEDGAEPSLPQMVKGGRIDASHQDMDAATEEELVCETPRSIQTEQNPTGNLLQDVVDRFTEKLETITPLDKDSPLTSSAMNTEEEEPQSPPPDQSLHFHADAHLTEIITTVLHSGSNSDYNLSELFHRHDSKQPRSPNTRSRCRQKVLAAMSTPNDDASSRRHSLQIKRELAMFDQSYCRRKEPLAKRVKLSKVSLPASGFSLDTVSVKEEPDRGIESPETKADFSKQDILNGDELENKNVIVDDGCIADSREAEMEESKISEELRLEESVEKEKVMDGTLNKLTAVSRTDKVKEEIQAVIVTEDVHTTKTEEMEIVTGETELSVLGNQIPITTSESQCNKPCEINREGPPSGQSSDNGRGRDTDDRRPVRGRRKISLQSQGNCFDEERRTRRNIVPPQRFSSYVTEPRKMYFVACFSEGIFNQRIPKEKGLTCSLDNGSKDPDRNNTELDSRKEALTSPEHTGELAFESAHRKQGETSDTELRDQSTVAAKEKSPPKPSSPNQVEGGDGAARPHGRLRSSPRKPKDSESKTLSRTHQDLSKVGVTTSDRSTTCVPNAPVFLTEYVSPIKLMYVSPLRDEDGIKYSLKSAGSGSSAQAQESFDPCEVSSWAGTPARNTASNPPKLKSVSSPVKYATSLAKSASASPKSASSPPKSASTPSKSASSPPKSASSPPKSASSPPKSASSTPKSASSPPKSAVSPSKVGSRRSVDGTPPKCASGTESLRSPGDFTSHETTPPKRRPGRPKKLGPQQENKVKRPIGRPRKQKPLDPATGADTIKGTAVEPSDKEENVNKNLKITVVYGRSRRNKRMVSEGFEQLPTESHDAWQAADQNSDWGSLNQNSETCPGSIKAASTEWSEDLNLVRPVKECVPHTSSNIICQKHDAALPVRKPGRPAKVKISGISVTVTTVSPRQRKIQLNKERRSPETLNRRKALLPIFKSAKEPRTISHQTTSSCSQIEETLEEKGENGDNLPNRQVAVRHSMRVRKPSMYFLHSVATSTSRSFSRSTALLKRSKQLMLNKAMNERKEEAAQNAAETSGEKDQLCGQERPNISQDFSQVAGVSVDPIFSPEDTLRWWAESTEEKTLNQELARRIRIISDTWVSDTVESRDEVALNTRMGIKGNSSSLKKSKHPSMVRILFDCPPSRPRSCSMQQLCSWFMQTTETQSLDIVKKTSSRNPYEHMHFPRTANKTHVCPSPQAERLRKHVKKFAKTVPKSPYQHRRVQKRLRNRNKALLSTDRVKRQLFGPSFVPRCPNQGAVWLRDRPIGKYQTTLLRARTRFLTRKERVQWPKRQRNTEKRILYGQKGTGLQLKYKASCGSAKEQLFDCLENSGATSSVDQTQEPADVPKEHTLSSKAWSPETLKECRVFLRKINSPDNESVEEEWDSCTVTLDDGSPSAYQFARSESEMVGFVKAVKTERKRSRSRTAPSSALEGSAPKPTQEQVDVAIGRRKGKHKRPGVASTEALQPAKKLRQSRMRGLSGPRWCDFVFEN